MGNVVVSNNKAGVNTANTIMWQLRAPTNRLWVYELGLSVSTATTSGPSWQLARATATGTNSATQVGEREDPGGATPTGTLDNLWSVAPTVSSTFMRRYATSNAIGAGIVWTWTTPLAIPAAGGLIIYNANASGTTTGFFNIYVVWAE